MSDTFDREKIVECMFDPTTSSILAQLEDGQKECSYLAEQSSVSESEVRSEEHTSELQSP